jgi:hypothetical protein
MDKENLKGCDGDNYHILPSKINSDVSEKDDFEIIESIATFHHITFAEEILNRMQYYSLDKRSLSMSIGISEFRLGALLSGNAKFEEEERRKIKNRLHF